MTRSQKTREEQKSGLLSRNIKHKNTTHTMPYEEHDNRLTQYVVAVNAASEALSLFKCVRDQMLSNTNSARAFDRALAVIHSLPCRQVTPPIDNKYVEPGCEQFTGVSELTKGPSNPVKSYVTTDDRCSNCGAKLHLDKEIGEFQDEVRALVIKLSGAPDHLIDGKGSDAGWQEFTLAEIGQGFAFLKETMDRQHRLMVSAEKRGVEKGRESDRALLEENKRLKSELAQFRAAIEREKSPEWSKDLKDLSDRIACRLTISPEDRKSAARELRYMADCFTLKANFVPTKLMLEEARRLLDEAGPPLESPESWIDRKDKFIQGVMPQIYEMPNPLLETARDLLSRCPGIRTDETREYWDEVQAFLGREATSL